MFFAEVDSFCHAGPDVVGAKMAVARFQDTAVLCSVDRKIALELGHQAASVALMLSASARSNMSDRSVVEFYPVTGHLLQLRSMPFASQLPYHGDRYFAPIIGPLRVRYYFAGVKVDAQCHRCNWTFFKWSEAEAKNALLEHLWENHSDIPKARPNNSLMPGK